MSQTLVIVCGPTAGGKSARALTIAQSRNGVIINADAMQVYRELRVLTARPSPEEEATVPHRLYGALGAAEVGSAARWLALAKTVIDQTLAEGKLPVLVGGTGLYLKALMTGLSPIPDVPAETRGEAQALYAKEGAKALAARDPALHARLKSGDTQRHVRALEVFLATGRPLSSWQSEKRQPSYPDARFEIELLAPPRAELYARCDARLLKMMGNGALEEVRQLRALGLPEHLPAMRAVGVRELVGHLEGKWDLSEAVSRAQRATRQYAKRQMTWFTRQPEFAGPPGNLAASAP